MANRYHQQGPGVQRRTIFISLIKSQVWQKIHLNTFPTFPEKGRETRDIAPWLFLEVKHITSAHIPLTKVRHTMTVNFKIYQENTKLPYIQNEKKENVCKGSS